MKALIYSHLPVARSLAKIASDLLVETRQAAVTRVSDLRSQVDDLWQAAGELLPQAKPAVLARHVERTLETLRNRDMIQFPKPMA